MKLYCLDNKEIHIHAKDINAAFADYPFSINMSEAAMEAFFKRNLFDPSFSFVAMDNEVIVGFALTGRNANVFYDMATAVLKDYRHKGIAGALISKVSAAIAEVKGQYLLECLSINDKALSLYQKSGFKISRTLNVYKLKGDAMGYEHHFQRGLLHEHLAMLDDKEDRPSFQNSLAALRNLKDVKMLFDEHNYLLYNDKTKEVMRLHGPNKKELVRALQGESLAEYTFVNLDEEVYPLKTMEAIRLEKVISQYELVKF